MKQLLKNFRQISIFFLAISIVGCSDDDGTLPEIIPGYTQTINEATGTVTFINISENSSNYLWTFGDGTTSTEANPIKTFPPGTYTVTLEATNSAGATETFEDTFTIPGEPVTPEPGALQLPITFDDDTVTYEATTFNGVVFEIVDNPDASGTNSEESKVGAITNVGAEFEGLFFDLTTAIDLTTNKTITMNFWADAAVAILMKLEEGTADPIETSAGHGGTGWESISFDFTSADSYSRLTLFVDGPGTTAGTFYIDDIDQTTTGGGSDQGAISDPCAGTLIQDFEAADNSIFGDFGGGTALVIDNPNTTVNTSAKVGQMQKFAADTFGGTTLALATAVDFTNGETFTMDVFSQRAAALTFKLEGLNIEQVINTAGTGWETMTFDFTGMTTGAAVMGVTLIFDNGTNGDAAGSPDDWTFLFDNLRLCDSADTGGGAEGNLITNGGFETGDNTGWETALAGNSGTFAVTDALSKCDTYSANIAVSSSQLEIIRQTNIGVGVVTPNSEITISFDLRGTAGPGGEFVPILFSESTTDGVTKTDLLDGPIAPVDTWTRYTFTTTTGPDVSNGVSLLLQAVCGAVDGCSVDVYLDNVFIAPGAASGPECDGGTVGGGDTVNPVILLNGDATVNLTVGASYTDAGATASDNVDGDISGNIVVGGDTVDTNAVGSYAITYNVSDAAGNAAAQITRTVIVGDGTCSAETTENIDPAAGDINWTFQTNAATHTFDAFGNTAGSIVANPVTGGINSSCNVEQFVKTGGCETWSGLGTELATALDFTSATTGKVFTMKVLAETQIADVTLRLERLPFPDTDPAEERIASITQVGAWQELTFDFSSVTTGTYKSMIIYFERNASCDGDIYYFDDIVQSGGAPAASGLGFTTTSVTVDEGAGTATFTAALNGDVAGGFTVDYATADGSAVQPADYSATSGTLNFTGTNGESYDIVVPIVDDISDENQENFVVNLSNISNAAVVINIPQASGVITDNDIGADGNLITNGDFEAGDAGWQLFDGASISTTVNNGGSNSAEIQGIAGPARGIKQERFAIGDILPNTTYTVSFDIIASGPLGIGGLVKSFAFSEGADGGSVPATLHTITDNLENISTTSWQTVTNTFTTPGNANQVEGGISFLIEIVNSTDEARINIDNVSITLTP